MAILITGAGLVGSHVARALQDRGEQVVLYDIDPCLDYLATVLDADRAKIVTGDITDPPHLARVAQENDVSCIVHTAALIGASVSREPYRGVQVNVGGTIAAAEAARRADVPRLLFCSTMAVYDFDRLPTRPIDEETPRGPKNLYAATKLAGEQLLDTFRGMASLDILHLRLAGVVGRGRYAGGSWVGRVLNRALEACLEGRAAELRPEWLGVQEYVYVKDVAAVIAASCLGPGELAGAYNIGTGVLHGADQVVDEIRRVIPGAQIHLEAQEKTVSYLTRTQAYDISKAQRFLGYAPRFTLGSGLEEYVSELRRFGKCYDKLA
ncbi:MAG: NAD(P)-dependent oxidoreductase [Chloroflexi bacterium]|nr:NAD(P)-dependent oxidoreductase [Chloroflexota bacterium]